MVEPQLAAHLHLLAEVAKAQVGPVADAAVLDGGVEPLRQHQRVRGAVRDVGDTALGVDAEALLAAVALLHVDCEDAGPARKAHRQG